MSEKEMGAWYFWWHRMFAIPYSDDLVKRMEEERLRQMKRFVTLLAQGLAFMAFAADELPKKRKKRSKGENNARKTTGNDRTDEIMR